MSVNNPDAEMFGWSRSLSPLSRNTCTEHQQFGPSVQCSVFSVMFSPTSGEVYRAAVAYFYQHAGYFYIFIFSYHKAPPINMQTNQARWMGPWGVR
jgi:hypothetical protein